MATYTVTTNIDENDAGATVGSPGGSGLSLREALTLANGNATDDVIDFDGAAFSGGGTIMLTNGELFIGSALTIDGDIDGDNTPDVTIDADGASRVMRVSANDATVGLNGLVLTGGNVSGGGGGLNASSGTNSLTVNITNSEILDNTASGNGGGISGFRASFDIQNTRIENNAATSPNANYGGGGIYIYSGTLSLTGSSIASNMATGTAGIGGGILAKRADVTLTDSAVSMNSATLRGGGILMREAVTGKTLNITGGEVSGNSSGDGGGIHIAGAPFTVELTNVLVDGNTASGEGGGIWNNTNSTVRLTNVTVSNNTANGTAPDQGGGGIFNNGGPPGFIDGMLYITNSTFSGNVAARYGGGLYNYGSATLTNVTFAGNQAYGGGAINNNQNLTLTNSTLAYNSATDNSGGLRTGNLGSSILANSIVLGNTADDLSGSYTETGPNIIGGVDLFTAAQVFAGPLADNGGPVRTVALIPVAANPALDAGDDTLDPATDARGEARVDLVGPANNGANISDLGAFEVQALPEARSLVVTTDQDLVDAFDGLTSLREAIAFANDATAGNMADGDADNDGNANDTITFAHSMDEAFETGGTIALTQGQLSITSAVTIDGDVDSDNAPDVTIDAQSASRVINTTADTTLIGLTITGGSASWIDGQGAGGGIRVSDTGSLTVRDSVITDNIAEHGGGGIYGRSEVSITNSTVSDNRIVSGGVLIGGGIGVRNADLTLTDSFVLRNDSGGSVGGGIAASSGSLTLTRTAVSENTSNSSGGGIWSSGNLVMIDSIVNGNTSQFEGGGLNAAGALSNTVLIQNSTISGNTTTDFSGTGGGIRMTGVNLSMENSTVSNNKTLGSLGRGGGIYLGGSGTLTNVTVSGNYTQGFSSFGGGIFANVSSTGAIEIFNSTVTGNSTAGNTSTGGGIYVASGDAISLVNSVVLGNETKFSGVDGDETEGTIIEDGPNIIGGTTGAPTAAEVFTDIDLTTGGGLLADNGGPVQTVALKADIDNAALDAGDDTLAPASGFDARGLDRKVDVPGVANNAGNRVDLGAYELQATVFETPSLVVTITGDTIDPFDGETSLREAIIFANDTTANGGTGDADNDGNANDTITFANGVGEAFETGGTIYLSSLTELQVTSSITIEGDIDGDGAPDVTVNANSAMGETDAASQVFYFLSGTSQIIGLTITGAKTTYAGAGILANGATVNLTVTDSVVTGNETTGNGGGINVSGGAELLVQGSEVTNNIAGLGGGIDAYNATVTVIDTTVAGNSSRSGGGLRISLSTAEVTGVTIVGNAVTDVGGGVEVRDTGSNAILTNVTISDNEADRGGGIFLHSTGTASLVNTTVSGNQAASQGGGIFNNGTATVTNSIVSGNAVGSSVADDIAGSVAVTLTSSLVGGDPTMIFAAIDTGTASTLGGQIADNGGPVQTIALMADIDNPALDAGNDSLAPASGVDARGLDREVDVPGVANNAGNLVDLGAYELQATAFETPSLVVTIVGDTIDPFDGETSLREAIAFANDPTANGGTGDADNDGNANDTITFAHGTGDAFENGGIILLTLGQLSATAEVTIDGDVDGDHVPDVTIDAQGNSRILDTTQATTLRGLILTNGKTLNNGEDGGAVRSQGDLAVINSIVRDSSTAGEFAEGGGLFSGTSVTLTNSTVSGNATSQLGSQGGGVYAHMDIVVTDSTISDNATIGVGARGGGLYSSVGSVSLSNSTVSGNSTRGENSFGGGVYAWTGVTAVNSTITGNSTTGAWAYGGGVFNADGQVTITNSTITGNSTAGANAEGGGIMNYAGTTTLANSLVLGNVTTYSGVGSDDVNGTPTLQGNTIVGGDATLIFAQTHEVLDGNNAATGVLTGTLADNGGLVKTVALKADIDNPALDAGDDTLAPVSGFDARGLDREVDIPGIANNAANTVDLGAYELQDTAFETPSLIVTITGDIIDPFDGETSLREAILFANDASAGTMADGDADNDGNTNDAITFAHGVGDAFENGGTIYLSDLGALAILSDVTIDGDTDGDGTPDVTINANSAMDATDATTSVFFFGAGTSEIIGLTLTGGHSTFKGGGIEANGGSVHLTVTDSIITGNRSDRFGGGISVGGGAVLHVRGSEISGNDATSNGGGIFVSGGTATVIGSTIAGNTAISGGGVLVDVSGTLNATAVTIVGNAASAEGGGMAVFSPGSNAILTNVTISDNDSGTRGGGLFVQSLGTASLVNTTVSGNHADSIGGGIHVTGFATITNSIVSGNAVGSAVADDLADNGIVTSTNNLIGGDPTMIFASIDTSTASTLGGQLADNGGPVQTIALRADFANPALDAGNDGVSGFPATDARGLARVDQTAIANNGANISDLGAFELQTLINALPEGRSRTITINEDSAHGFAAGDFGFHDANVGDTLQAVRIDTLSLDPDATLSLGGIPVTAGQVIAVGDLSSLIFAPGPNESGTNYSRFTFSVQDSQGAFDASPNQITINVTPVNDDPVAGNDVLETDTDVTVAVATAVLLANDSDIDGGELSIASVGDAVHGTVTLDGDTVTFTPEAGYSGDDAGFDYVVSDGNGGTDTGHVAVLVNFVNTPPSAPATNSVTTDEDTPSMFVPIGASDVDGHVLTYSLSLIDIAGHGDVTLFADGFVYTPRLNENGQDAFSILIDDGHGGFAKQAVSVTINPVNDAPVATDDTATGTGGLPGLITAAHLLSNDTDVDGDVLTVSAVSGASHGTATLTGDTVTFTPDAGFAGTAGFDYQVSDGNGGSDIAHVIVTVVEGAPPNNAPVVDPDAQMLFTLANTALAFSVMAGDPDGDPLTFTPGTPMHGTLSGADGSYVYTPDPEYLGGDSVVVSVNDGRDGIDSQTIDITVTALPLAGDWRLFASDGFAGQVGGSGLVVGTAGFQAITVANLPGTVVLGPSFNGGGDFLCLIGEASDWSVVRSGSNAVLTDGDTFVIAPVGEAGMLVAFDDGMRTLVIDGTMQLGDQVISTTMTAISAAVEDIKDVPESDPSAVARLFIAEGGEATAGGTIEAIGTNGPEALTMLFGSFSLDPSWNEGNDTIAFASASGDFSAQVMGSGVLLSSTALIASIPVGEAGTTLAFANVDATLLYDAVAAGVFIGPQAIGVAPMMLTFA
ncbi:MAG: tandem-95 repeat protein [Novosphingobium sp.]|nr:tandem-95 repeat protein [Novosphingobium sp.]